MTTLKKLGTSFTRAQMWKQYNKLCEENTVDMYVEELMSHREALRLIKKISTLSPKMRRRSRTRMYVLYFKLVCIIILISVCHILN
jgi:hypothetical protein